MWFVVFSPQKQGLQCQASSEQVMLYQLSYDWLTQDDVTAQVEELQSVYLKIWTCKIQMELDSDSSVVSSISPQDVCLLILRWVRY